jgi:hypothetical protein
MRKILLALLVALLFFPVSLSAGKIAEVFSGEIFGVKWGSNQQQVSQVFPKGKSKTKYGIQSYTVRDGRTLFEIKRKPDSYIQFVFNSEGQLHGVNIEFPNGSEGFGTLLNKLTSYFGQHIYDPNKKSAIFVEWPEDAGIKIMMGHVPGVFGKGDILFSIENLKANVPVSKDKLGF